MKKEEVIKEYRKKRQEGKKVYRHILFSLCSVLYLIAGLITFMTVGAFLGLATVENVEVTGKGALVAFSVMLAGVSAIMVAYEYMRGLGKNE